MRTPSGFFHLATPTQAGPGSTFPIVTTCGCNYRTAGFDVEFVGGKRTVVFDPNLYPRVDEFDRDYEGEGGMRLSEMLDVAPMLMQENNPDVVLLKTSSDVCRNGANAPGQVSGLLPSIISSMRAENPNVHFILGTSSEWIYNTCDQDVRDHFPAFNQAIMQVADLNDTPQSRVLVSDHYDGFNFDTMFDLVNQHNNRQGEMFVANRWFDVLEDFLPTIQGGTSTFSINAGLNDAWYNPLTPGQGFFVTHRVPGHPDDVPGLVYV